MNSPMVVLEGVLKPDGTLVLDRPPELPAGRVRVTLQPVVEAGPSRPGVLEVLQKIWKDQEARGYKGRTLEEMEAEEAARRAEDEAYEERWRRIWSQTAEPSPPEEK